jgi:hypothetical protein
VPTNRSTRLAAQVPRARKRRAGRTPISKTPVRIRATGLTLTPAVREQARTQVGGRLARFATLIDHVDVRFEDVNGPRGGIDTVARIQVALAGRPRVFVAERGRDAPSALARAASAVSRAMAHATEKRGIRAPAPTRAKAAATRAAQPARSGKFARKTANRGRTR